MADARWTWDDALCGVIPPMISPLGPDGEADGAAVGRVVGSILDAGCTGLFVLGGVGEGAWLSARQRAGIVRATVEATAGRAPVLVGLMLPGTAPARDEALRAADLGAHALVVGAPYYFGADGPSQRRHVEAILHATPLPVLLYNIPQCTHAPLAREMVSALAAEPRILGVKDSWGDLPYFQSLLDLKQTRPTFRVLQGHEHAALASLRLGADGLIPGHANIAPRLFVDLLHAARTGDGATCQHLHARIVDLTRLVAPGFGLAGIYAAAARLGLADNRPAEPWPALGGADLETIDAILRAHDLLPVAAAALA